MQTSPPALAGDEERAPSKSPSLSEVAYDESFPDPSPRTLALIADAEQKFNGASAGIVADVLQEEDSNADPYVMPQIGGGRRQPSPAPVQTPTRLRTYITPTDRAKDLDIIVKSNANRAALASTAAMLQPSAPAGGRSGSHSVSPGPINSPLLPNSPLPPNGPPATHGPLPLIGSLSSNVPDDHLSSHLQPGMLHGYSYGSAAFAHGHYGQPGHPPPIYGGPPGSGLPPQNPHYGLPQQSQAPQQLQYGQQHPAPSVYAPNQPGQGFPSHYGPYGYSYGGHPIHPTHPSGPHGQLQSRKTSSDYQRSPPHDAREVQVSHSSLSTTAASLNSENPRQSPAPQPLPSKTPHVPEQSTFDAFLVAGGFQSLAIPNGPPRTHSSLPAVQVTPPTPAVVNPDASHKLQTSLSSGFSTDAVSPISSLPTAIDDIFGVNDASNFQSNHEGADSDDPDALGESPTLGCLSKEKRRILEDGFDQLNEVAQKTSEATGLSIFQIIKRWNTATTHVKSGWNIYQQYFKEHRAEELDRVPEANRPLAGAVIPVAIVSSAYQAFQKTYPDRADKILQVFNQTLELQESEVTLAQRGRLFKQHVEALDKLIKTAQFRYGFETGFYTLGSVVNQDQSLAVMKATCALDDFHWIRLRLTDDEFLGHLRAHTYDIISRGMSVNEPKLSLSRSTTATPSKQSQRRTALPLHPSAKMESVSESRSDSGAGAVAIDDLKDGLEKLAKPIGTSFYKNNQFQWKGIPGVVKKAGYEILNWPREIPLPGTDHDKTVKGISGLSSKHRARLLAAMEDETNPLSFSRITKKSQAKSSKVATSTPAPKAVAKPRKAKGKVINSESDSEDANDKKDHNDGGSRYPNPDNYDTPSKATDDDVPLDRLAVAKKRVRKQIVDFDDNDMFAPDSPVMDGTGSSHAGVNGDDVSEDETEYTPIQPRRLRSQGKPFAGQRALFAAHKASVREANGPTGSKVKANDVKPTADKSSSPATEQVSSSSVAGSDAAVVDMSRTQTTKRTYRQALNEIKDENARAFVGGLFPVDEDEHGLPVPKRARQSPSPYTGTLKSSMSPSLENSSAPAPPSTPSTSTTATPSAIVQQSTTSALATTSIGPFAHASSEAGLQGFVGHPPQMHHAQMYYHNPPAHPGAQFQHVYNGYPAAPEGYAYHPPPRGHPSAQPYHAHPGGYHPHAQYSDYPPLPPNSHGHPVYGAHDNDGRRLGLQQQHLAPATDYGRMQLPQQGPS